MTVKVICPRCRTMHEQGVRCSNCAKVYDRNKRKRADFYHTKEWQKLRAKVIQEYNGVDIWILGLLGVLIPCKRPIVHHIRTYEKYPKLALDFDNLIPLSTNSHNYVHDFYDCGKEEEAIQIIEQGKQRFLEIKNGRY